MQSVVQKHDMSCGLACVAFVTKQPYDKLAAEQFPAKLNWYGFLCPELVEVLKQSGLNYGWKKLPENERDGEFNNGDIVFIEPSPSHKGGHFLVKTEKGWMDPWINLDANHPDVSKAESGFRDSLPGRAEYIIYKQ